MNIPLKKIEIYKNFIENNLKKTPEEGNNLYIMIGAVEAYYEIIAEILIPASSRSKTQHKLLLELKEYDLVNFDEFTIMNETRKLKNDITHRLDYEPPISVLYDFNNNCKIENKKLPKDKESQSEIEECILFSIISGYKIIEKKLTPALLRELEVE